MPDDLSVSADPRIPADIARTVIMPQAYAEDAPVHEAFRWLRANNPVGLADLGEVDPFSG